MEDSGFFIDNEAASDNAVSEAFKSPFPIFNSTKLVLDTEEDAEESSETSDQEEDDEYFGKFYLFSFFCPFSCSNVCLTLKIIH